MPQTYARVIPFVQKQLPNTPVLLQIFNGSSMGFCLPENHPPIPIHCCSPAINCISLPKKIAALITEPEPHRPRLWNCSSKVVPPKPAKLTTAGLLKSFSDTYQAPYLLLPNYSFFCWHFFTKTKSRIGWLFINAGRHQLMASQIVVCPL